VVGMSHPRGRVDAAGPGRRARHRGGSGGGEHWRFITRVRRVDGAEGEWLRRELAAVVRDLAVWCWHEVPGGGFVDGEDGERAA